MKLPQKDLFELPHGMVYLNGNSLGPLPKGVADRVHEVVTREWGGELIRAWNTCQWMDQPARVGNLVARIIGARQGSVTMGDTLSIKVFQALSAAIEMRPGRRVILSDTGNFPSDLYMAEGLIRLKNSGYELVLCEPETVMDSVNENVAAVLLTEVDYRTARRHNMRAVTECVQNAGAVMVWDLAHSAGAIEIDLDASRAEFAVGCTYKYLNGGPGAPAFIYVRPDLVETVEPALSGWLGHDAPFAFEEKYRPGVGIERMRVGTPSVIQMSMLEETLKLWEYVSLTEIEQASKSLSQLFISEVEKRCPELVLVSPRDPEQRGSHVSFSFMRGYEVMQAVIKCGLIGDFRAPDMMRFGFSPLYVGPEDIVTAAEILEAAISEKVWENPEFSKRNRVT